MNDPISQAQMKQPVHIIASGSTTVCPHQNSFCTCFEQRIMGQVAFAPNAPYAESTLKILKDREKIEDFKKRAENLEYDEVLKVLTEAIELIKWYANTPKLVEAQQFLEKWGIK